MRYSFDFEGNAFRVVDTYRAEGITVYELTDEDFKDLHAAVIREHSRRTHPSVVTRVKFGDLRGN